MTKSQDYRDGFTAGLLAGMAEVDKAVKALTSTMSGIAAGYQFANQVDRPQVVNVQVSLDGKRVADIANQTITDIFGRIDKPVEPPDDQSDAEEAP